MPQLLRHAILGEGGVGGLIGACLARSGAAVTVVVRPAALAQYPEQLKLASAFGSFVVPVKRAAEVPPCDVLWIAVKATQLEASLAPLASPDSVGAIVPLLNGIDHLASLREKYGKDKVIAATIAVESERVAPGHIVHRSPFARLNVSSAGRNLLGATLDELQKMGFECRFIDDEATLMWTKIVFLVPLALTTTAAMKPVGGILSDPVWRQYGRLASGRRVRSPVRKAPRWMRTSLSQPLRRCPPICAARCRRTSNRAMRRNWMRSQDRSCAAPAGTESKFRLRGNWSLQSKAGVPGP